MEKKRYWLKLDKDFLNSSQIRVIKNLPNGKDYLIFYLALLLESVETVGHLRFSELVPYNEEMLASITDTNVDIVRSAMKVFNQLGLLKILTDGTIFMTQVADMTGKESDSAERVRQYRLREKEKKKLQCNTDVTKSNDNKEVEEEIENNIEENKNIEVEEEIDISSTPEISERDGNKRNGAENLFSFIEKIFGRPLGSTEIEHIEKWEDNELTRYAIKQAELARAFSIPYIEKILSSYKKDNITKVSQAEERDKKWQEKSKKNSYKNKSEKFEEALSEWKENYK